MTTGFVLGMSDAALLSINASVSLEKRDGYRRLVAFVLNRMPRHMRAVFLMVSFFLGLIVCLRFGRGASELGDARKLWIFQKLRQNRLRAFRDYGFFYLSLGALFNYSEPEQWKKFGIK